MPSTLDTARFRLVTAAHHFLLSVLPLQEPTSRLALEHFLEATDASGLRPADVDAVLLRCLSALDRRLSPQPALVTMYLMNTESSPRGAALRFRLSIERLIRGRAVRDSRILSAIQEIERRLGDERLNEADIAAGVDLEEAQFSALFHRELGVQFNEYVRRHRLDRAAYMLTTSSLSIKEIWASVGFHQAPTFTRQFKHRFKLTPREYRERQFGGIRLDEQYTATTTITAGSGRTVLIIDDDEGTRLTVGRHLASQGHRVVDAQSGGDGVATFDDERPDVVLLDYHLPDLSGLEVLRAMRRITTCGQVVVFTADWSVDDHEDEIRSLNGRIASKLCNLEDIERLVGGPSLV